MECGTASGPCLAHQGSSPHRRGICCLTSPSFMPSFTTTEHVLQMQSCKRKTSPANDTQTPKQSEELYSKEGTSHPLNLNVPCCHGECQLVDEQGQSPANIHPPETPRRPRQRKGRGTWRCSERWERGRNTKRLNITEPTTAGEKKWCSLNLLTLLPAGLQAGLAAPPVAGLWRDKEAGDAFSPRDYAMG